ncbi:hypothetical protein AA103196_3045 [Ameyamaea chiangmaiensis NBRC 103196]|uniref:CopD family protein n=1 Tax=Ameyamaea chiangmaiensis TaxID=442969 RepID=A0A850PBQ9_9PROT|nr:CopD family protein [Ameyamaea chiangmaiensis]MBS4074530.1 CopD family protein [Ameyamaea chiangmaiensis]NVN41947.1 CopD family protein [Ameyamaea chiangmaiensis]GBQ72380.1 hypothetical protein AA103196_3045 [Ameyamaea chiangmaiensis NBRC 103196]
MSHSLLWSLVLAIHIAGMTLWVGGAAYAVLVLRPSLGLLDTTQRSSVHLQTLNRFFRIVWHVMPMVLASGWAMVLHEGGFANTPWPVNLMQLLGLVMAGLFASAFFGPYRKARRALRPQPALFDAVRTRVGLVAVLGMVTILSASLNHGF